MSSHYFFDAGRIRGADHEERAARREWIIRGRSSVRRNCSSRDTHVACIACFTIRTATVRSLNFVPRTANRTSWKTPVRNRSLTVLVSPVYKLVIHEARQFHRKSAIVSPFKILESHWLQRRLTLKTVNRAKYAFKASFSFPTRFLRLRNRGFLIGDAGPPMWIIRSYNCGARGCLRTTSCLPGTTVLRSEVSKAEQSLFLLELPVGHSSERSNLFPPTPCAAYGQRNTRSL